ncbi:MAG: multidrug efflux pump subunit AcrA (membrane-fusion protein) [Candidatus Promineifilaceae bacterium]|jgi:multidrug efflux pump subunit AcrA (membrane-fusion protein)
MKHWLFVFIAILVLAIIGGAGYWGYLSSQTAVPTAPSAPLTISASLGDVQRTVTAPGQLVGTQQMMLGVDVDGRLIELNVRPGTTVSAGDIIARIDPTRYKNALESAQIELAQAELAATVLYAPFVSSQKVRVNSVFSNTQRLYVSCIVLFST